ncbi:MAG TPA: GtrA family protein [Verrucomicrobiales bacterium]|jgi:putative flippase GtrA|nr:GtrA family protein [Verrucomicrobiales bacterium]
MELDPPVPKISLIRQLVHFLRANDFRTILEALHSRDVHPVIQFFKYAVCGVCALVVHTGIFFLLARFFLPALESNVSDPNVRANHALINSGIALLFSNTTAYWLNHKWVFTPGRYSLWKEYLLFTAVNAPGVLSGAGVQDWLIRRFAWPAWAAFAGFVAPNLMINFTLRKLFIFKK